MTDNSRFAIAVHTLAALGFLKKHGVERASSTMIAQSVNTNAVVIRNLIHSLKKSGLVLSKEGKAGGISLSKPPVKISLWDIFQAVEDSAILSLNKNPEFKPCPVSRGMKRILPSIFSEVDKAVAKTLKGKSLQEVIDRI
jgi:Rrf2 family protein